ncbi:CoA-binding protein [Calidifontibacillus oryziterrae]|uniref:CoA-binding protein n=1 Tax=Calidifontibacillus oryziterrae TaxID=1191699 RepID=UPI0002FD8A65|nr:CoA-binding protein [Calidifontibacillus oryziterrae]
MKSKLQTIVSPKSIAIVGASDNFHKNAGRVMVNLEKSNFHGSIYLVNPKYEEISGIPSYPSVVDIEEDIDIVCVIIPADRISEIIHDCVRKNVKNVMILSSGFSENGLEGIAREKELKEILKGTDISVYGPNSPGFYQFIDSWGISFSPRFEPKKLVKGSVGIISHGGSLGRAVLDANEKGLGFTYWFSPGNELDINTNDCFEFLINDSSTKTIILIVESITEEERFFRLLHEAYLRKKPVLFLPIGNYELSRTAIKYHLGSTNQNAIPWEIVNHPGFIKVESLDELVAVAWMFDAYGEGKGDRTVIFTWAGATSIYLADLCCKYSIALAPLSEELKTKISKIIGINKVFMNPLDLTTYVYDDLRKLTSSLDVLYDSGDFDNIIVPFPFQVDYENEVLSVQIKKLMMENRCIFIPIFMSQGYQDENATEILKDTKYPIFFHENTAIKALSSYLAYNKQK